MNDPNPTADHRTNAQSRDSRERLAREVGVVPERIGRFEVRRVLGEGAFGRVYLAFDCELDREVAIKTPKVEGLTLEDRERFLREAKATSKIHHPHVCPIYDVGTHGDLPYIVMRFVPGGNLAKHLASLSEPPSARFAVNVIGFLANGLAVAHENGVIHRDIKPANVLYNAAQKELLLTDFGLARIGFDARMSQPGAGTPSYMAPEQFRRKADLIGPQTDVYSLGVILYEMLTGRVPFVGEDWFDLGQKVCEVAAIPPSVVRLGLDPRLDALCLKALAKDPADRYASAKDFADALGEDLQRPAEASTAPTTPPPVPPEATEDESRAQAEVDYQQGENYYYGRGVPEDLGKARVAWLRAAVKGNANAQYRLGSIYLSGNGVGQNSRTAREWLEKAAEQGMAEAQHSLGFMYSSGWGIDTDYREARKWYEKAVEQNHAFAQVHLARLYEEGRRGLVKDVGRAIALYRLAAKQGHPDAKKALARLGVSE